jgi:diacylglycerol kinase
MVTDEFSEQAGKVKDISASAVMVSAFVSVIIGILVFIEPLIGLFM